MTGLPGAAVLVTLLLAASQAAAEVATGCLTRSGTINKVAIGNDPRGACGARQTEITLRLGGGSSEPRFRFVGVTTATATGAAGIFGLSALCSEEFPGSRICMSREFVETMDAPPDASIPAWIHPTFVPSSTVAGPTNRPFHFPRDISGQIASTCNGWSTGTDDDSGLSVQAPTGRFVLQSCNQSSPVACCAP